jgi:predicted LPLAT superfamily acyltransferase
MVREKGDTFSLIFEKPIYPETGAQGDEAVRSLMKRYLPSLESAIRKNPGQWFVFRYFWEDKDGKSKRSNTVI